MLTLKDCHFIYCKCLKEYIQFKNCGNCVNYTYINVVDLTDENNKDVFCKYKEDK